MHVVGCSYGGAIASHWHLGLDRLYQRTGPREHAHKHKMYREMDMRFWLEKVEAEVNKLE